MSTPLVIRRSVPGSSMAVPYELKTRCGKTSSAYSGMIAPPAALD
jgi:hypothetical protein